jgi:hypothetical protein
MQICARGIHNGQLRTAIVLCHYDVGDSHHMATSCLSPRKYGFHPSPVKELPLYELNEQSSFLYPLALQEHIVFKINSVIACFNGHRTVSVENDAWVNTEGFAVASVAVCYFPTLPCCFLCTS